LQAADLPGTHRPRGHRLVQHRAADLHGRQRCRRRPGLVQVRRRRDQAPDSTPMTDTIEITVNGEARAVAPGTTVRGLLDELEMPRERVAVELNRRVVRK